MSQNRIRVQVSPRSGGGKDDVRVVAVDGKLRTEVDLSASIGRIEILCDPGTDQIRMRMEVIAAQVDVELPDERVETHEAGQAGKYIESLHSKIASLEEQVETHGAMRKDHAEQVIDLRGQLAAAQDLRTAHQQTLVQREEKIAELEAKLAAAPPETPTGTTAGGPSRTKR